MNIMKELSIAPQKHSTLFQEDESPTAPHELDFGPGNYQAIRHTCEAIGLIIETWGFKRVMGSIWAFLYLCPEPATAKDICKALKISPALVSISLQDLLRWHVVKKIPALGKRRDYFVAEHDVWKMIQRVFVERERTQLDYVKSKLGSALQALDQEKLSKPDFKSKRTCQFQRIRVEDLLMITDVAINLMDVFTKEGKMDISPLHAMLKPCHPDHPQNAAPAAAAGNS